MTTSNGPIRLITMLKRKPGLTHAEFLTHWYEVHGPLIKNCAIGELVQRYEQHPASWPSEEEIAGGAHEPEWDGVTIQEYAKVDDFWAQIHLPDFAAMNDDINKFLDTANMPWVLCDEANVVIDRSGS